MSIVTYLIIPLKQINITTNNIPSFSTWVHNQTALLGDACHPTLPHLNQGAALAIEDAAVLAVVLSHLPSTSPSDITKVLKVYQDLRKERADTLVALAAQSGRTLQLGEGKAREERDAMFRKLKEEGGGKGAVPDKWADGDVQRMIFGFDCVSEAEKEFQEAFAKM